MRLTPSAIWVASIGLTVIACRAPTQPAAAVPRVTVVQGSGGVAIADLTDALANLAWPSETMDEAGLEGLIARPYAGDIILWMTPKQQGALREQAERLHQWVRYGGVLLIVASGQSDLGWLGGIEPGLRLNAASSTDDSVDWVDARHTLLAGVATPTGGEAHLDQASGRWSIMARCDHDLPLMARQEVGDGLIVVSCVDGYPEITALQNLWRWARDNGRIEAARAREEERYQAVEAEKTLEAKRVSTPVLDGLLDDETWRQAATTRSFLNGDGSATAEYETVAYVGMDDYWLYVAFDCRDNMPAGTDTLRDGVTMQVTREEGRPPRVTANPTSGGDTLPGIEVETVSKISRDGWTTEMRVPIALMGGPTEGDEDWWLELQRERGASSWAPEGDGKLTKVNIDPTRFQLKAADVGFEDGVLSVTFDNPTDGDINGKYIVEVEQPDGSVKTTVRDVRVRANSTEPVETEHLFAAPGTHTIQARFETGGPVWFSDRWSHTVE